MLLVYAFKFHVSPWWRMKWHPRHHGYSGTKLDVEERLIGLGLPLGVQRFLITISPYCYILASFSVARDNKDFSPIEPVLRAVLPSAWLAVGLLYPAHLLGLVPWLSPTMVA